MTRKKSDTPMKLLTVTRCEGEGQGECTRCREKKGRNRYWTTMLYEVDGIPGVYCSQCVEQLRTEKGYDSIAVTKK